MGGPIWVWLVSLGRRNREDYVKTRTLLLSSRVERSPKKSALLIYGSLDLRLLASRTVK